MKCLIIVGKKGKNVTISDYSLRFFENFIDFESNIAKDVISQKIILFHKTDQFEPTWKRISNFQKSEHSEEGEDSKFVYCFPIHGHFNEHSILYNNIINNKVIKVSHIKEVWEYYFNKRKEIQKNAYNLKELNFDVNMFTPSAELNSSIKPNFKIVDADLGTFIIDEKNPTFKDGLDNSYSLETLYNNVIKFYKSINITIDFDFYFIIIPKILCEDNNNKFHEFIENAIDDGFINISYNNLLRNGDNNSSIQKPIIFFNPCDDTSLNNSFLDSSIWFRFATPTTITGVLQDMESYFSNSLYTLQITNEFREFRNRMVKNSYLIGGHEEVVPFPFHSEGDMSRKTLENIEFIKKKLGGIFPKINLLLIDDHTGDNKLTLRSKVGATPAYSGVNKEDLLKPLLDKLFGTDVVNCKSIINIENGINELTKQKNELTKQEVFYDIILLDYLFTKAENGSKFGVEIFKCINANLSYIQRPVFGELVIMYITSYPTAFFNDMENKGIALVEDGKWRVERGADFINTPYLFSFYLTDFIKRIVDLVSTSMNELITSIEEDIGVISKAKWEDIQDNCKVYQSKYVSFQEKRNILNYVTEAKGGILKQIGNSIIVPENFGVPNTTFYDFTRLLHYYENLLYNLSYKNYKGNEEIIIYFDLLKNSC